MSAPGLPSACQEVLDAVGVLLKVATFQSLEADPDVWGRLFHACDEAEGVMDREFKALARRRLPRAAA